MSEAEDRANRAEAEVAKLREGLESLNEIVGELVGQVVTERGHLRTLAAEIEGYCQKCLKNPAAIGRHDIQGILNMASAAIAEQVSR